MNTVTEQAIKNASSSMFGKGLKEIMIGTKPSTKTRFYGSAVYNRGGYEILIDFAFNLKGIVVNAKKIHEIYKPI
jgi:hypothetical protein